MALVWTLGVACMVGGLFVALRGDVVPGAFLVMMGVLLGPGGSQLLQ